MMTVEQAAALRKPFDAKTIGKLPKGNTVLDFVGHAAVTDRLLAVDPGWQWEPFALDEQGFPAFQNGCLWIKLTVCGITRIGVGDGPDPKQRIGDAIRNAAMRFGVALDLWSRQELEGVDPNGGDAAQRVHTAQQFEAKHHTAPPSEDPAVDALPDLVENLTNRVYVAIQNPDPRESAKILARLNAEAGRDRLLNQPTQSPSGKPMAVGVLIDEALKRLAREKVQP